MRIPQLSNERQFKHYFMGFDFSDNGPKINEANLELFWEAFKNELKGYERSYKNGTRKILIRDVQNKADNVQFLIGFGDTNTPDPSLMHVKSNKQRVIKKDEFEGQSFGGHALILKKMYNPFRYAILVEDVPGITTTLFKVLVRSCAKTAFKASGILKWRDLESHKEHVKKVTVWVEERPSQTLKDILEHNTFLLAELSSSKPTKEKLDNKGEWVRKKIIEHVHIGPKFSLNPKSLLNSIKNLMQVSKKNTFDSIKLHVKDMKTKRESSVVFDVDNDLDTFEICMKTPVKFTNESLPQSPEKLNDNVCQKMYDILNQ